jgi:hypothetical protein
MEDAHAGSPRDVRELDRFVGVRIDPERGLHCAASVRRPDPTRLPRGSGGQLDEARRKQQTSLIDAEIARAVDAGLEALAKHHQLGERREGAPLPDRWPVIDPLDELGRKTERQTLVAVRVIVRADEFLAREADHHGTGDELMRATAGNAAEAALAHVGQRIAAVALDERQRARRDVAAVVGHRDWTGMQRSKAHGRMLRV